MPSTLWSVLETAWASPFTCQSDFAREHAIQVAFAASMGWLTTILPTGSAYSRKWHITAEGLTALTHKDSYPT